MLLFRQLSAMWGSEFAQIDLVVEKDEVMLGESFSGYLIIEGGKLEYEFQRIDIDYQISLYLDEQEVLCPVERKELHQPFVVQPATKKIFPFTFQPAPNAVLSSPSVVHHLVVHVHVSGEKDSSERILIQLHPGYQLRVLFTSLKTLGFQELEHLRRFDGYVQEFRFQPTSLFTDEISEVRLVATNEDKRLRILLETVLFSYLPEKEVKREIIIDHRQMESATQLSDFMRERLQEMIAHPYAFSRERYFHYRYHHKRWSKEPGTIGAWLQGRLSIDHWLEQERQKERLHPSPNQTSNGLKVEKNYVKPNDDEFDELFRDVFLDDFFDDDDN